MVEVLVGWVEQKMLKHWLAKGRRLVCGAHDGFVLMR